MTPLDIYFLRCIGAQSESSNHNFHRLIEAGQRESGRRLWVRLQLKPSTECGVYGSSREAISSGVRRNESAATAS
jgi:hypothetical protein